jgi:Uncharacterized protein conserved in bacteria
MVSMKERHPGVDLLRILSMYLVLVLHIIGQGGILSQLDPLSLRFKAVWFMEIAAYCSVNCYALVTGYVSARSEVKYSRIITLWLQVVFYTLLITVSFKIFMPNAVWSGAFQAALMPVTKVQYWYFTAYFGLFFMMPYLNKLVSALTKVQFKGLVLTLILLFSVLPTFCEADLFSMLSGYSMLWLIVLYLIGAYIRLHGTVDTHGKLFYLSGFLLFVLITWCFKFFPTSLSYHRDKFIGYTSPTIVATSVCLFLFCIKLTRVGRVPGFLIKTFSPSSFGVYLIHTHPLVWMIILNGRFSSFASSGVPKLAAEILGAALIIFIACSLVDMLRSALFKLLRIGKLAHTLEAVITPVVRNILSKDKEISQKKT